MCLSLLRYPATSKEPKPPKIEQHQLLHHLFSINIILLLLRYIWNTHLQNNR
ncbi:hypothetical protein Hanom_Chr16g01491711 [Helianthus anomalus]